MKVIWKYKINMAKEDWSSPEFDIPGCDIQYLSLQMQDNFPTLWVKVNPDAPLKRHKFRVVATGEKFDDRGLKHLGTFQRMGFVFHLFEVHDA